MRRVALLVLAAAACSSSNKADSGAMSPPTTGGWFVELVPSTDISDVPLELESVSTTSRVDLRLPTMYAVHGSVVDEHGQPVLAHVTLWRDSKIPGRPALSVERTDAGHGFDLALPTDKYTVRVSTKGAPGRPAREFSVELGGAQSNLVLKLPPASDLRNIAGTVAQVVDSANHIAIAGLTVKAIDRATGRVASTSTVTGTDGTFTLQVWKGGGAYDLVIEPSANAPGFPTLRRTVDTTALTADSRGNIDVGVIAMPRYTSPQPYTLAVSGSADSGGDVRIPGATVTLQTTLVSAIDAAATGQPAADFSASGQVGTDGTVTLMLVPPEAGATTRTYALQVQPPAGSSFASIDDASFQVDSATARKVVLRLPSKVRLSGSVATADGKPVENAVVEALPAQDGTLTLSSGSSDGVVATGTTDSSGKYLLRVDRGRFDVRVKPPQGSPYPRESQEGVAVMEGLDLPFSLPKGGKASGVVQTDTGSPLSMVEVRFYEPAADGKSAAQLRGVAESSSTGAFDIVLP